MSVSWGPDVEWLEPDGLGGYASGTVGLIRTRRYHALLLAATTPPTGRMVLVNGFDASVELAGGRSVALSAQRFAPDTVNPDGASRIEEFAAEPWPRWRFRLGPGVTIDQDIFVPRGYPAAAVRWKLRGRRAGARLTFRPFLSCRDYHQVARESADFRFDARPGGAGRLSWRPRSDAPGVAVLHDGEYAHAPLWYRNFLYTRERERGLDFLEDLASPGEFRWDLSQGSGEAVWIVGVDAPGTPWSAEAAGAEAAGAATLFRSWSASERRRRARFPSRLHRAADAYLAARAGGRTILAGFPWFTDWGRDTFISLRGLCLATGRLDEAREILLQWSGAVRDGLLPNRFTDEGDAPEYNTVDGSLWFVIAARAWLDEARRLGRRIRAADCKAVHDASEAILEGYARGTSFGIRLDDDGLVAAGEPGVALTWMDARVDGHVITPRIGKPVEIQALWLNALRASGEARWREAMVRGAGAFRARFWSEPRGYLHDVVDVDHQPGTADPAFRPNQIFAVGGLPAMLLDPPAARRVVDAVEQRLLTPLGLRTLAPGETGYHPRYRGDRLERDSAYHQGTVWPWLLGPFVEAWVRVHGGTPEALQEARQRFLAPLLEHHMDEYGLGHLPEIADADPPHTPAGCPFQAWSIAEALRAQSPQLTPQAPTL